MLQTRAGSRERQLHESAARPLMLLVMTKSILMEMMADDTDADDAEEEDANDGEDYDGDDGGAGDDVDDVDGVTQKPSILFHSICTHQTSSPLAGKVCLKSLAGQHLLHEILGSIIISHEPEHVPDIDTHASGVVFTPLELIHETLALSIKIDSHKLSVCIHNRATRVATDGIRRIEKANRDFLAVRAW